MIGVDEACRAKTTHLLVLSALATMAVTVFITRYTQQKLREIIREEEKRRAEEEEEGGGMQDGKGDKAKIADNQL